MAANVLDGAHSNLRSEHTLDEPLEWVGDLYDLRDSDETIPRYIRSLQQEGETLNEAAHRLSN